MKTGSSTAPRTCCTRCSTSGTRSRRRPMRAGSAKPAQARPTSTQVRVDPGYVPSPEIAEEVVQETWIALLKGIRSFEGRSSLRTWLFTVLINIAKRRGVRERRDADMAVMAFTGGTVDPARFRDADDP